MQRLEGVMYDEQPVKVVVGPTIVDVCISSEQVEEKDAMHGTVSVKWKCTIERYDTAEYIDVLQKANGELNDKVIQNQLGLVEVYEMLL